MHLRLHLPGTESRFVREVMHHMYVVTSPWHKDKLEHVSRCKADYNVPLALIIIIKVIIALKL